MQCGQTEWLSNEEYWRSLVSAAARSRIPLSGSIALTHRCNLNCQHCYLGAQHKWQSERDLELNTDQVQSVISEIVGAGCLFLLITGGDPLLRSDFGHLYRYARQKGLLVTVFTNGTLVTDRIVALFEEFPPRRVEISLYGANAETHDRVTGVPGSHERSLSGIRKLVDSGVSVNLKTVLMSLNRGENEALEQLAGQLGAQFRYDGAIFPCLDGDRGPLSLRISPREIVQKDFADQGKSEGWADFFRRFRAGNPSNGLYACGAGVSNFHIDPYGRLQPCLLTSKYSFDLKGGSFDRGWKEVIPRIRDTKVDAGFACNHCEKKVLCGFCPAFFQLETGAEDQRSPFLCALGQLRYEAIAQSPRGGHHAINTGETSE